MNTFLAIAAFLFLVLSLGECFNALASSGRSCLATSTSRLAAEGQSSSPRWPSRRVFLETLSAASAVSIIGSTKPCLAAVGSLPEYADTNAILQGITINVADKSQQDSMIAFLTDGLSFKVLRKRIRGSIEETWLGFGPEQLSIPDDFELPVSSFATYGGHSSIHLKYDEKAKAALYRTGDAAPGDNIAYVQVGVPGYRISQMVANGGNILDAYGKVEVVSPSGLPIRAVVGIAPDPLMFVAINCVDVRASKAFYEQLGFVETSVPYSRPSNGTTIFEPAPPPKSVYMAPTNNGMGVLLLPTKRKKAVVPNPVVESLNIVYTPASGSEEAAVAPIVDPSGVAISFQSVGSFDSEERATR